MTLSSRKRRRPQTADPAIARIRPASSPCPPAAAEQTRWMQGFARLCAGTLLGAFTVLVLAGVCAGVVALAVWAWGLM